MARNKLPPFIIAIDNREKTPYRFDNSQIVHLKTGDYSIIGQENLITIDRKNPHDAVETVIHHRERFEKELERMLDFYFRAIVIESSLENMLKPYKNSNASPKSVIQSYLAFQVRYNVHVIFAGSRLLGQTVTLRLLEWAWHAKCKEMGVI